jgi:imidazole glycerol-phosphate synthase subunit HisF
VLKNRLIPILILNGNKIVQSFNFRNYLPIGNIKTAIEFFNNWDVDEIVLLDIMATRDGRKPGIKIIEEVAKDCFVPLTIGGGIKSVKDVRDVIRAGADKVIIGSEALRKPELITEIAKKFGNQCITISIDYKNNKNFENEVFFINGQRSTGLHPLAWAKTVENLGAGEILLYSIERDGSRHGYDLDVLKQVATNVKIPVIACGGVGRMEHIVEGIQTGLAQAVAAGNIFHHTEHSTIQAKAYMKKKKLNVRLSSIVNYENFNFDQFNRAY